MSLSRFQNVKECLKCHQIVLWSKQLDHEKCDCCAEPTPPPESRAEDWEIEFKDRFGGNKTYSYFAKRPDEIKDWVSSLLASERKKLCELLEMTKMGQEENDNIAIKSFDKGIDAALFIIKQNHGKTN